MNIKKNSRVLYITVLLMMLAVLFPTNAFAASTVFAPAPPATTDINGGNVGQVGGSNEIGPRGYSIDLNGADEEGGMYWLENEYDNYNWNPVYSGKTNGYSEPIPACDENGNTITYDFYAWIDLNPRGYIDKASGEPFLVLFKDGERVEHFPGKLDEPVRDAKVNDPTAQTMTNPAQRQRIHFTMELEPGHDYELGFLRGMVANNGVSMVINEEETGYIRGTLLQSGVYDKSTLTEAEYKYYEEHKFDEYEYREYHFVTYAPSDEPQSKKIDTTKVNPYEGKMRPMRFRFTTKMSESLYTLIAQAEELCNSAQAGTEPGQYPQEAIDALTQALATAKAIPDDAPDADKEAGAEVLRKAINSFEDQCYAAVSEVSIVKNVQEFYVGQTGKAKAEVTAVPDKAANKKVVWSASDNITINPKTGEWQIDYADKCWIKATALKDETKADTWEFEVPVKEGELNLNLSKQTVSGSDVTELEKLIVKASGGDTSKVTSLKISTAESVKLVKEELEYIRDNFPQLKTLDLSDSNIDAVTEKAFRNMSTLQKIELPATLDSIENEAFVGCSSLTEIEIPAYVTHLGSNIFAQCKNLGPEISCRGVVPPTTDSEIKNIFAGTGVNAVKVPYGCKSAYNSWASAYTIKEAPEKSLKVTSAYPGNLEEAAVKALGDLDDSEIDTLIIDGNAPLNDADLAYFKTHFPAVSTLDIQDVSLKLSKNGTFKGRKSLKKVVLPGNITTLSIESFKDCVNLSDIVLPETLDTINDRAFSGCKSLPEELIIEAEKPPTLSETAFEKSVVKGFIVPGGSVDAYKKEFVWKDFKITSRISVSLDRISMILEAGSSQKLTATVDRIYGTNKAVIWSSSDSSIAQVDNNGNVTARKAGTAIITVATRDGGVTAQCRVTVNNPPAPQPKLSSVTYNSAKISWKAMAGASNYEVYRATSKTGNYVKWTTLSPSETSYTNTGLITGQYYYYKIRTVKEINGVTYRSDYSDAVSAKPALSTVKDLKVKRSSTANVKVSWTGITGESGYQIYRATSKNGSYSKVASVKMTTYKSPYAYVKTTRNKTYYYKVRAYRYLGNGKYAYSAFSGIVSTRPALDKISSVSLNRSSSSYVKVKWRGVSNETGYQVYRAKSKYGTYTKVASVKMSTYRYPYAKIKTTRNRTYYYKVRAYKYMGYGEYSYGPFSTIKSYKLR